MYVNAEGKFDSRQNEKRDMRATCAEILSAEIGTVNFRRFRIINVRQDFARQRANSPSNELERRFRLVIASQLALPYSIDN